jgi:hypothetical protein
MAYYLGREWSKTELISRVGDPRQIAAAELCELAGGKAEGVKAVNIDTGAGLRFTLLPGRGMDIAGAHYRGKALAFLSGTGIVSPAYHEEPGLGFLRSFFAGLLTTCGITSSGAPSVDGGRAFGLHGRLSNSAAEDLRVCQEWRDDEYLISVKGMMREAGAMEENLTLTRSIETRLGRKGFTLHDLIENRGFEEQPLMMLYHFNFGFPLLGPAAEVVGPVLATIPRDEAAAKDRGVEEYAVFPEPRPGYLEKVFFHSLAADEADKTFMALLNRDIGDETPLGVVIEFNRQELPCCTQWKMARQGFYVLGLEPGTVPPLGRAVLRERQELPMLAGQQSYSITIDFRVVDSGKEMRALEERAARLQG